MFPPGAFGVGVTVAELRPALEDDVVLPEGVVARPSRLGDLLPVHLMTPEQKAANLQRVAEAEAQLAAFKAELVVGLAADRPATEDRRSSQPGAASGEWAAQLLDASVSEFYPDELSHILNCSRAEATRLWEHASTLQLRLPRTWAALADGELDWPRARAIAAELGWPARDSIPAVLAAVEAAVLPQATGLSVTRLRALVRSELLKADAAAADARRKQAERQADVTVRGLGDGMSELRSVMPTPDAAEVRAAADARARELKAAGDERPLGMLRAVVLHELMTRPWQEQPAVSAHVAVVAPLDILEADDLVLRHLGALLVVGSFWRHGGCRRPREFRASFAQANRPPARSAGGARMTQRTTSTATARSVYSVEIDGSAWTFSGMIIRKLDLASATRPATRSASSA